MPTGPGRDYSMHVVPREPHAKPVFSNSTQLWKRIEQDNKAERQSQTVNEPIAEVSDAKIAAGYCESAEHLAARWRSHLQNDEVTVDFLHSLWLWGSIPRNLGGRDRHGKLWFFPSMTGQWYRATGHKLLGEKLAEQDQAKKDGHYEKLASEKKNAERDAEYVAIGGNVARLAEWKAKWSAETDAS